MPDSAERSGPRRQDAVRRLARPAVALFGVILFQLLLASAFVGVLHHPVPHQALVAVAGRSPLAQMVSGHGAGTVRLVDEPTAAAARAALSGGQVNAAIIAGPTEESLLIQTAASPGTAGILTKELTTAAAALRSSSSECSGRPYCSEFAPRPSPWPTATAHTPARSSAPAIVVTWSTVNWCAIACDPSRSVVSTIRKPGAVMR